MKMIQIEDLKNKINMLPPPSSPVTGRGFKRVRIHEELNPSQADEIVQWILSTNPSPHLAVVSVREPINRFGKLGTPKKVFCSPEFFKGVL